MITTGTAKIRLVKCPQCMLILPELQGIPVYECGGCGKRLQAKGSRINTKRELELQETVKDAPTSDNFGCAFEGKESTTSSHESVHYSEDCSLDHPNASNQMKSDSWDTRQLSGISLTDEDQTKGSVQDVADYLSDQELGSSNFSNEDHCESDKSKHGICANLTSEVVNFSKGSPTNRHQQKNPPGCKFEQPSTANKICPSKEPAHHGGEETVLFGSGNSDAESNEGCLPSAGEKTIVESDNSSDSCFRKPHPEKLADTNVSDRAAGTNIPAEILFDSPSEQPKQAEASTQHVFECVRSPDTFEATDFVSPSSELSGTLVDLSKSPTTRSSRAYYDDGVSSCEGIDVQLSNQQKHSYRRMHRPARHATSDERLRREKMLASDTLQRKIMLRNYPSFLSEKTQNDRGPARFRHSVVDWRRLQEDYCQSKLSFCQGAMAADHETGGPSKLLDDEVHSSSHDRLAYTEHEKLMLLRMVKELQDRLTRVSVSNEKTNRGFSIGAAQGYSDGECPADENFLNCYSYAPRVRELNNWSLQSQHWRIPFSTEATNIRRQVDHSLCCCPKEWQRSTQLPPSGLRNNRGLCSLHPNTNLYRSSSSSSLRPTNPELAYCGRGVNPGNPNHRDHDVKKYSREKHYSAKRFMRPMSGGAPFITCSRCQSLLYLPSDFLLIKRRCHRVICYTCSEALKFTLVNGSHLVPYMASVETPPPSEVDDANGATTSVKRRRRRILGESDSRHADAMSCSDDGFTVNKSNTTTTTTTTTSTDRNPVAHSSFNDIPTQSNVPQNKHKRAAGTASKKDFPDKRQTGGSPLHQLMGYSSPIHVIRGGVGPSGFVADAQKKAPT